MDTSFEYVFPAIRGIQAGREYYVSMCPLRIIPKIFLFDEEELVPELRAQRILNRSRIPEMGRYLVENKDSYVFSSLTASIDGDVKFRPIGAEGESARVGALHINMQSQFIINDGQHRRAAIELALRDDPGIGDETISVVFFVDRGLKRCQQMFADLNRYAVRPSKSLGILYDHRDDKSRLARDVVGQSSAFRDLVEMERSTLSARSRKLFTLSAVYSGNTALLNGLGEMTFDDAVSQCVEFWDCVGSCIPEWELVRKSKLSAGDVRQDFVHSHSIVLQSLGHVGNQLIGTKDWKKKLAKINEIDWARSNASLWEGRAMNGGRVSKAGNNVALTTNAIKVHIGLPLSDEEQAIEKAFLKGEGI